MTRFSKGTLDHDGNGTMGGSRKGTDMTKTTARKPTTAVQSGQEPPNKAVSPRAHRQALLASDRDRAEAIAATKAEIQAPTPEEVSQAKVKKAAAKAQFAEADRKGAPTEAEIAEATMSRSIRGW